MNFLLLNFIFSCPPPYKVLFPRSLEVWAQFQAHHPTSGQSWQLCSGLSLSSPPPPTTTDTFQASSYLVWRAFKNKMISIGNKCTWKWVCMHKSDKSIYSKSKLSFHSRAAASQILPTKQSTPFSPLGPAQALFNHPSLLSRISFSKAQIDPVCPWSWMGENANSLAQPSVPVDFSNFLCTPHTTPSPSQAVLLPGPHICSGLNPHSSLSECIFKNNF